MDAGGYAASVIATREPSDSKWELWWAHTGGGGGNFGIVARYWFRSADSAVHDPATLLPAAPASISTFTARWNWEAIGEESFMRLAKNFGGWCEAHSGVGGPDASLWMLLELHRGRFGTIVVRGVSTSTDAGRQIGRVLALLADGPGVAPSVEHATMSWLQFALDPVS